MNNTLTKPFADMVRYVRFDATGSIVTVTRTEVGKDGTISVEESTMVVEDARAEWIRLSRLGHYTAAPF